MQLKISKNKLTNEARIEIVVEENDTYDDVTYFWFYFIEEALHRIKQAKNYV